MSAAELRAGVSLAGVFGLRMLGLFLILPVFAVHASKLAGGDNLTLVGIALGAYGLSQACLQIPFGMASDRWGRKPVIYAGLLIFAGGSFLDLFPLRGGEARRADHGAPPLAGGHAQVAEARVGHRELDEDAVTAERTLGIGGEGHADLPEPRYVTGVLEERGMPGGLESGYQAELFVLLEEGDETRAHSAGGAGDHDISHRGLSP